MKKYITAKILIVLFFISLLILPHSVQAQTQKIRVVVKNASIRLSPSMDSEILRRPDMGAVFDVVKKVDEWYEIKFTSQVGVEITGYIHEMFIEVVQADVPEMKREPVVQQPVAVEIQREPAAEHKGEVQLSFMYPFGYGLEEASSYLYEFPEDLLTTATGAGRIDHALKGPIGFGGAFNYILFNGLGVQVRFDMNTKSSITSDSLSQFDMTWAWFGGDDITLSDFAEYPREWAVTGDVSLMILSLNFYYKALGLGMIAPHFSGGLSYFTGNVAVDTNFAYATTWWVDIDESTYWQYIDYFILPASIDEKIGSIGFNAGGGIDIRFTRNIAFGLEARYFATKKIETMWQLGTGDFDSNINEGWTITMSADDVADITEMVDLFILKPSFFSIIAALKIFF